MNNSLLCRLPFCGVFSPPPPPQREAACRKGYMNKTRQTVESVNFRFYFKLVIRYSFLRRLPLSGGGITSPSDPPPPHREAACRKDYIRQNHDDDDFKMK